jgi:hypothetical protein
MEMEMRLFRQALLAGVAAAAIGLSGTALAQSANTHVMTVRLPNCGVAQIHYTGDVPPQVSVSEAPAALVGFTPMTSFWGPDSPFAAMERISAEIDRQMAAMLRQTDALMARANSGQPIEVAARNLPPGTQSYTFVSTMSGTGVCSQSVEITAQGNGPLRVVRHSSGNCGPAAQSGGAVAVPTFVAPTPRPEIIETKAQPQNLNRIPAQGGSRPDVILTEAKGAKPYAGLVREIPPATR